MDYGDSELNTYMAAEYRRERKLIETMITSAIEKTMERRGWDERTIIVNVFYAGGAGGRNFTSEVKT